MGSPPSDMLGVQDRSCAMEVCLIVFEPTVKQPSLYAHPDLCAAQPKASRNSFTISKSDCTHTLCVHIRNTHGCKAMPCMRIHVQQQKQPRMVFKAPSMGCPTHNTHALWEPDCAATKCHPALLC